MKFHLFPSPAEANAAAAELLAGWVADAAVRQLMVAAGNSPLELYRLAGEKRPDVSRLRVFALDEYVGVPLTEPRNCANLMRRTVAEAWGIPPDRFHTVSSLAANALESVRGHERLIHAGGGLDAIVLGLGQNGHLGFNEPGSAEDSIGRVLDLEPVSIAANKLWFGGDYAPAHGVTVGLKTILAARRILILAFGSHKTAAVRAMVEGPRGPQCPASFLQGLPEVHLFLDRAAAAGLAHRA